MGRVSCIFDAERNIDDMNTYSLVENCAMRECGINLWAVVAHIYIYTINTLSMYQREYNYSIEFFFDVHV